MSDVDLARVNEALQEVIDPCSVGRGVAAGLVDMGMVKGVELGCTPDGGNVITVELRTTSPACTFQPYFEQQVRDRLVAFDDLDEVRIAWNSEFDWSDDDMSSALKQRLREKRQSLLAMAKAPRAHDRADRSG